MLEPPHQRRLIGEDVKPPKGAVVKSNGIGKILNLMIRGWVNYYGKFRKSMLHGVFKLLNNRLVKWVRKRYKRYKTSIKRAYKWFFRIQEQFPNLFYHWKIGYTK